MAEKEMAYVDGYLARRSRGLHLRTDEGIDFVPEYVRSRSRQIAAINTGMAVYPPQGNCRLALVRVDPHISLFGAAFFAPKHDYSVLFLVREPRHLPRLAVAYFVLEA